MIYVELISRNETQSLNNILQSPGFSEVTKLKLNILSVTFYSKQNGMLNKAIYYKTLVSVL